MAKETNASHLKPGEAEKEHRVRHQESQSSVDKFHGWEPNKFPLGETPFLPRMEEHAALLRAAHSDVGRANLVLHLQRAYGNTYVQRLLESKVVQAKLTVNAPGDIYEKEADRVAEAVTKSINTSAQRQAPEEKEEVQAKLIQRQVEKEEEEEVQMQAVKEEEEEEIQARSVWKQTTKVSENLETCINNARDSGHHLSDNVREPMGQAFGTDFSDVRVHTDSEANLLNQQLSARAFTTARDIFFRQGEYSPGTDSGKRLIAHELTHVVQQTAGDGLRHQNYEEIKSKTTPEVQRQYPEEEKVPEAPEYGVEYAPIPEEVEVPEIVEYPEEGIPISSEEKGEKILKRDYGFNHLLNLWQGIERAQPKYSQEDLKKVGEHYRGEDIRSDLAYDIMGAIVDGVKAKKGTFEELAARFGWSEDDVQRYIYDKEPAFVKYMESDAARAEYEVVGGAPLQQSGINFDTTGMVSLAPGGAGRSWGIFVMSPDDKIYSGSHKIGLFHHSSFLAGQPIAGAGEWQVQDGTLRGITNKSGHYRPGVTQIVNTLKELKRRGAKIDGVNLTLVGAPPQYKDINDAGEFLRKAQGV